MIVTVPYSWYTGYCMLPEDRKPLGTPEHDIILCSVKYVMNQLHWDVAEEVIRRYPHLKIN